MRWLLLLLLIAPAWAEPDFAVEAKRAEQLLGDYVRIATVNPPADTRASADFVQKLLESEGITVERFESVPNKVNLVARLPGQSRQGSVVLLHHMDV
ncbi:MAG: hypothetical protein KC910_34750, partial [Candidatus Eremiobacteraeota bacterium]|nr:hypothetical protein [Candidatus Eremiobacteraeota bacterium]